MSQKPHYPREEVKRLAEAADTFAMDRGALLDALGLGLDDEDVRKIFRRIDEWDFLKSEPTRKHHPSTVSDYYIYYVEECLSRIFIKFVVADGILTVTSFKEDDRNDFA